MSLLGKVQSGAQPRRLRDLWYGEPGVGKTSLAACTPSPLIVSLDDGAGAVSADKLRIGSLKELRDLLQELRTGKHSYKTLVIDVLDEVERWIACDVAAGFKDEKGRKFNTIAEIPFAAGYKSSIDSHWRPLLADLEAFQAATGMGLVLLAWAGEGKAPDEAGGNMIMQGPRLHDSPKVSIQGLIYGWCENVLFLRWERMTGEGAKGTRDFREATAKQVGQARRVICTDSSGAWLAKNRGRGKVPSVIPMVDGDPAATWAELSSYLLPETAQEIRRRIDCALGSVADAELKKKVEAAVRAAGDDTTQLAGVESRLAASKRS